jgi:membrane-bound inhibitor of C-type lysozyme
LAIFCYNESYDKKVWSLIVLLTVITAGVLVWLSLRPSQNEMALVSTVSYLCRDGRMIEAEYYQGEQVKVDPGEMPVPNGRVSLQLSDGRSLTVPQTISASGIRYANADESFVFWSKGNGAFILENNAEQTYIGCVALAKDEGDLPNTYVDREGIFSVRYPAGYTLDDAYIYQELGPGQDIYGVKFIIPEFMAEGRNLSSYDTGLAIELMPQAQDCNAALFLYLREGTQVETVTDNDVTYSFAKETGAAVGNRYEEQVWAMPGTNPCLALRYFIHSTSIDNYPAGAVMAFDRDALMTQFDQIRRSLILAP